MSAAAAVVPPVGAENVAAALAVGDDRGLAAYRSWAKATRPQVCKSFKNLFILFNFILNQNSLFFNVRIQVAYPKSFHFTVFLLMFFC